MAGQSRRWMILIATVWIQAFTGTNFNFSSYSSELKAAMGISQLQLNYLAVASDMGKVFGWSSGLALLYFPLPVVLFLAAGIGFVAYGAQWMLITARISLPYAPVFLLCLLAGLSICCFNTVCFVLCIRNFSADRSLALSLTISFNGVSAALYTLAVKSINASSSSSSYLLLNAVLPFLASIAALLPILGHPPHPSTPQFLTSAADRLRDRHIFIILNSISFITGLYLLFLNPSSSNPATSRFLLAGALLLLALPLSVPGVIVAFQGTVRSMHHMHDAIYSNDTRADDIHNLHNKPLISSDSEGDLDEGDCNELMNKDRIRMLGEEHGAKILIRRLDFWLYYISYFCGATIGLVYSNNLGQIAQSLGRQSETTMLVNVYSSCSFFGRLISAAPDFLTGKVRFARTGWLAAALVPMPLVFYAMSEADEGRALLTGTALLGLCSGFIFAAAVSVTSELFGPASFGVNHNILITNIPLGSLLYGLLAALVYDENGSVKIRRLREAVEAVLLDGMVVCMGRRCYAKTFLAWGCTSMLGLACGVALYLRTRAYYARAAAGTGGRLPEKSHFEDLQ